jgi:hypothetical protein
MILINLWEWSINLFVVAVGSVLLMISSFGFMMMINLIASLIAKKTNKRSKK